MTDSHRKSFAEKLKVIAKLSNPALIDAFARVRREDFVGAGPWQILPASLDQPYQCTPDADPRHLYQDVLVALDPERHLNNGLPSWLARAMELSGVKAGETVVHIGAGVGYYTAIFADVVGVSGRVLGIEVDSGLAERAKKNLAPYKNVEAVHGNGSDYELAGADVIFVNAGATHVQLAWLQKLNLHGRLLVPLTYAREHEGQLLRVTREPDRYRAEFVHGVYMYPCVGSREDAYAKALKNSAETKGWEFSGELRLDPHNADSHCWVKTDSYWLRADSVL